MNGAAILSNRSQESASQLRSPGDHLIASVGGPLPGPTLIIIGGIHGNEPAGVRAAERVLPRLDELKAELRGEVVLLRGNTRALREKVRYIDADLNRQWKHTNVRIHDDNGSGPQISEFLELDELLEILRQANKRARGEVYFLDLHTTSAHGSPFATVGDTLRNRRFALKFPVTIVLGLEEQIDGTLLEYINNLGAVTMGFEAGQHDASSSVDHHEALIWNAVVATGNLRRDKLAAFEKFRRLLDVASGGRRVIEVRHRHAIVVEDRFRMKPGFSNFQKVKRGQELATDRNGEITALETGLLLLPLYQALGDDGFFLAREVKRFWLTISALLRRLRVGEYIHVLPGVRRDPQNENFFVVNTRVARIMPLQIFHLLGFRRRRWVGKDLVVSRRAYDLSSPKKFNI